jgi:methylenetetrahydrofolate reductase (NADPH)
MARGHAFQFCQHMPVTELINTNPATPSLSFEVLPPLKGNGTETLFRTIDMLKVFRPKHINITTHKQEYVYQPQPDGTFLRNRIRRRPGTIAVASAIMQKYDITVVPHLVCSGFSSEEIEYMLLDLQFLGITDILTMRGDKAREENTFRPVEGGWAHATELIEQVNRFNSGVFEDGSPIRNPGKRFSYGVACYPEKHEEAPNIDFDIQVLKRKQDLGAEYAITQLFYDNATFFAFVERARAAGVTIPIIPALKPLAKLSQFSVVPRTFHCDLPLALSEALLTCKTDDDAKRVGVEWGVEQCRDLIRNGFPHIHFFTVSAADSIRQICETVF